MTNTAARNNIFAQLEADRFEAEQAARQAFAALTPAQQASELVARMEVAKLNRDKAKWLVARAELMGLIEKL